jgi:hypothetical protein
LGDVTETPGVKVWWQGEAVGFLKELDLETVEFTSSGSRHKIRGRWRPLPGPHCEAFLNALRKFDSVEVAVNDPGLGIGPPATSPTRKTLLSLGSENEAWLYVCDQRESARPGRAVESQRFRADHPTLHTGKGRAAKDKKVPSRPPIVSRKIAAQIQLPLQRAVRRLREALVVSVAVAPEEVLVCMEVVWRATASAKAILVAIWATYPEVDKRQSMDAFDDSLRDDVLWRWAQEWQWGAVTREGLLPALKEAERSLTLAATVVGPSEGVERNRFERELSYVLSVVRRASKELAGL